MKKLSLFAAIVFCAIQANAQTFYIEDFDDCAEPSDWTAEIVSGSVNWTFSDNPGPNDLMPTGSIDGSCMVFFDDDILGGGALASAVDLTSPVIDLSSLDTAVLRFDYLYFAGTGQSFEVALWNGASWDTVFVTNTTTACADFTCTADQQVIDLSGYLNADFQARFIYTDGGGWNWYVAIDNIEIYVPPTADAVAIEGIGPANSCGLSATEELSIVVFNNGDSPITSIDAGFEVGNQTASESFTVSIAAGETDTLDFLTTVDLSSEGTYEISLWVDYAGDQDQLNDTTFYSVQNIPVISTLPYSEDFESGAGGWTAGGVLSTWELGDPETAFIDTANSGVNAWVTNLDGFYNVDEKSFVESPCFDFSALTIDPVLRFAFIVDTEPDYDGAYVEVSLDGGATWSLLGNVGEGTNWYDNGALFSLIAQGWNEPLGGADEWFFATHLIDGAAGQSDVKLRIFMNSDDLFNEWNGFAFDDIEVFEQPPINVSVNEVLSPITGCGLSAAEEVTIVIENVGDADVVDYDLGYDIGAGDVIELQGDTLFAGEIDTITFTTPVDISVSGTYELAAWSAVVGDGDALNDSIFAPVTSAPVVSALPYLTDFESGTDGWYSEGENGIWELGDPEGILIDTANSGFNAWATNLDNTLYANNQLSYLISPCFDFSSLVIDPIIEFAFISNSEVGFDGMWLEASLDAGATWSTVGNVGEGTNWYNNADEHGPTFSDDWWDGNTQDSTEWIVAENLLTGVAGSSDVVLRFVFDSDGSVNFEGFAVDDISITEQPPVNGELTSIESPVNGCGLTASETIEVLVTNLGSVDMDSVVLGFTLNNGTPVEQIFNDTLQPNETDTFAFTQTIDLSAIGDYELIVWLTTIGDGDTENDTLSITVVSVPTVASFPYSIDFESGANGWIAGGVPGVWELGEPETAFIDTANSGVNAWVTVLNGDYPNLNNDTAFVESPCLDFSGITADPILSFAGIFETESCCDEGWVEISLDGGLTWAKLGAAGEGTNWYNDAFDDFWNGVSGPANQWLEAEHLLDGAAGQSSVKIRFAFSSDGSVTDAGFGLDDISIREQPQLDLVVISFDDPTDGCDLGDDEEVTMTFWNKGLQDVSGFDLGFRVDGGLAQTETYSGTVNAGDTITYTLTTELADLSGAGTYSIDVFTALAGDEDLSSDTLFNGLVENFGSSTPLSQTEEPVGALINSTIAEGTSSSLFFCGLPESLDGCLEIVSLSIDSLNHTWLSDLDIFLISPEGDSLELSTDNGGSLDNMVNVVFTDTAVNNIITQTAGIAPGFYFPEDSAGFASFYTGQNPNGEWTLWIDDDTGGDNGQLFSWSLTFQDNSPMPVVSQSDTTICLTHVLTVSVEGTYDSYLWSTGNNSQEIDIFGNILGLGTTEVSVTVDEDGCTGTSESFTITVDACAGINELDGLTIDVYPNPTNGNVMLDIEGESDGFVVDVLDINGKSVYNQSIGNIGSGVRKVIDLSHVAKGIYFLRLDDGQSFVTRKLIKQ